MARRDAGEIDDGVEEIVVGHHSIRSGGSEHGDTPEMVALVDPILHRNRVQVYLNGHEHDLQHIHRDGIDYVCSGAGSEVRPTGPTSGTRFAQDRSGFAVFGVDRDAVRLEFRDYTGASLYTAANPAPLKRVSTELR